MELLPNERLDEVNDRIRLIQKTDGLTFGTDALLLAAFVRGTPTARAVELGSGTGIVSLLCAARGKAGEILAVEVQEAYAALTRRNAELNRLNGVVTAVCADLRNTGMYGGDGCDLLFTNPPYMTGTSGFPNRSPEKNAARHESNGGISDFCRAAAKKLRYGGRFFCVYRPERLTDLLVAMREVSVEPKRMTFVAADSGAAPSLVLVEGRSGGAPGLILTEPLSLYADGTHTAPSDAMRYILGNGRFPGKEEENT